MKAMMNEPSLYGGPSSVFSNPMPRSSPKDEDTEALAGFLLSLKHRSVTPDPHSNDSCSETKESSVSYRTASPLGCASIDDASSPSSYDLLPQNPSISSGGDITVDLESLVADSKLVQIEDRDLVPDPLFAAMAQMKPCRLEHADRVGCYKNREIGFLGMACKHCSGQPGFGRYYPNSVRSLAQTTTSQTILKHIGSKCRFCPPEIRNTILELQRQQTLREGLPTGRPRYGSRKVFFQRIWQRLHGEDPEDHEEEEESSVAKNSGSKTGGSAEEESPAGSSSEDEEESIVLSKKRKAHFSQEVQHKRRTIHGKSPRIPSHVSATV